MNLTIKPPNGSNIKLLAAKDGTVGQLKEQIKKHIGFAPNEQKLLFNNAILGVDNKRLSECGISDGSAINFSFYPRPGMQIFAKAMDGKTAAFEICKNERISDVKKKVHEQIGLAPEEQILVYQGGILEDDKTTEEYQICEKSVINVIARLRPGMQIFAKTMDGKAVAFEICKNERIRDVKKKVHEKIGLAPEEQKLVYQGGILEDDKTADEYQICEKSVINVVVRLRNGMQIFAKTMDGKTFAFEICKNERIRDIKKKVRQKMGLAPEMQKLFYQARILEDDKTADEYQIKERSVINVVERLRPDMQIFVRIMGGRTVAFEICKNERIRDIKKKVHEKTGCAPEEQKLVYQFIILEDDKTADEYGICERSVIYVVARLT